jgi:hypothetical protein
VCDGREFFNAAIAEGKRYAEAACHLALDGPRFARHGSRGDQDHKPLLKRDHGLVILISSRSMCPAEGRTRRTRADRPPLRISCSLRFSAFEISEANAQQRSNVCRHRFHTIRLRISKPRRRRRDARQDALGHAIDITGPHVHPDELQEDESVRAEKCDDASNRGYELISYVSAKATTFSGFACGSNCFILEDNTIQPFVTIGNDVVMWSGNLREQTFVDRGLPHPYIYKPVRS